MNHCIPSFDIDEDYSSTSASHLNRATLEDNGIVELMWQNGQVVMQSQKSVKKSAAADFNGDELNNSSRCEIHNQSQQQQQYLFIKEDEMASWLHYPLNHAAFDSDFCSDLLYSSAPCVNATATETEAPASKITTNTTATQTASTHHAAQLAEQSKAKVSPRHPIPPSRRLDNFDYQSSLSKSRVAESVLCGSNRAANEFTVVDSNETPVAPPKSRVSEPAHLEMAARGTIARAASLSTSSSGAGKDAAACQMILTSTSPGTSSASPELRPPPAEPSKDRKRKGRLFEDTEMESPGVKKHARGLTSVKRSRAAEVHNLSERRRRDRINEKMRTLQELVPHCTKADKASMLDEAIEYLKSLQMQVQGMSMGCSMVPMMFPGVQQYVPPHPHMAAAMAMAAVGMNRPMMPFPNNMPGGSLPIAGAGPHLGSRFPLPATPNSNSTNPVMDSSFPMQNPNQPTNFVNPYRQCLSLKRFQTQQQNQAVDHQGSSKYGTSKGVEHLERHPTG